MKFIAAIIVLAICTNLASAAEPQWLHPWQHELAAWLKTLEPADLAVEIQPIDPDKLADLDDVYTASRGYGNLLVSKVAGVVAITPEAFTWSGIWQPDLPLEQPALQDVHHKLTHGQIIIPSHPTAANWLAWAYSNDRPWNGYRGNANLARRAAVIAIVDLMMHVEHSYYYHNPASSKPGRKYGIHQGAMGFTLTYNALTMLKVQQVLPEKVRQAWQAGLKELCSQTAAGRPTGPANMRISFPVALYYAYLATDDPDYLTWYQDWENKVIFGNTWDPAGVFIDGGAPDASYNGIALHRVGELYAINPSDRLRDLLTRAYTLRNYMSLPDPDGLLLAPSHFNDRCASSFPHDQYFGREIIFSLDVPEALLALRDREGEFNAEQWIPRIVRDSAIASKRAAGPHLWNANYNWQPVLMLPYAMYHQPIAKLNEAMRVAPDLPVVEDERYARSFNDHFFAVRRPGYAALFYAGPVGLSDDGTTNYRNMLSGRGGRFNGFAGGGMSAFWVQGAGSLILGRMNTYENYQRDTVTLEWGTYQIPGWQDWMNNHIIGKTTDGKIITSARCPNPKGTLADDGESLTITGYVPNDMKRQGKLFDGQLTYERVYQFHDDRMDARLTLGSDTAMTFECLYESLPVRVTDETVVTYRDEKGQTLSDEGQAVANVKVLRIRRGERGVDIVFPEPVGIALISEKTKSLQSRPAVYVRTLHVVLPVKLAANRPVRLDYTLVAK